VAALASCLDARAANGQWLLRIEDIDTPRNEAGAADAILRALDALGFEWDGPVAHQSQRLDLYRDALAVLRARGALYGCACSRREIADSALARDGSRRYPGTCRKGLPEGKAARAFRVPVEPRLVCFDDRLQGRICQDLAEEVGDFIVFRADGLFAYQLAVVVDDAQQGITDVVRGADLLDSTPRQIWLQRLLGLSTPRYLHLPVALDDKGEKLSKQTLAAPVDAGRPRPALLAALRFLGQLPPPDLADASLSELWRWAGANWDAARIPAARSAPAAP
jgi:glutamyl-Q tRNA(Asp) synthetase